MAATKSVAATTTARKGPREIRRPLVTREERDRRVALAKAFLDRYGRD